MRKISILMIVAFVATSCSMGTYLPYVQNNFGAQTKVVLDQANFRVVRDVEAIVDVNNTRMTRAAVANSAYGELLRKAQLTGSQVLINVAIEEIRRASGGLFRWACGAPKIVQHVAARATIIEFLDENGNPTVSQSYRPSNAQPVNDTKSSINEDTNQTKNTTSITSLEKDYNIILEKLNTFGWQNSLLYKSYEKAFNYLIENNKIDDAKKVNQVLQDVFDNKIYKSTVEKQLKTNAEKGIPEYQTFMKF